MKWCWGRMKYECGALVEWHWQGKMKCMKKKKFNFSFVHQKFHIGWRLDRIQASSYSNNCISQGRYFQTCLTFKNRASYIEDGRNVTLQMLHFNIFSTNISTEYFKHAAHSPFFSSKCRLLHNVTFFGSRIIHILHRKCAKI